jgi:hypothetical protein
MEIDYRLTDRQLGRVSLSSAKMASTHFKTRGVSNNQVKLRRVGLEQLVATLPREANHLIVSYLWYFSERDEETVPQFGVWTIIHLSLSIPAL